MNKNNYTQTELRNLPVVEICKMMRRELKSVFGKTAKFSVRKTSYSSIRVEVKSAHQDYFKTLEEFEAEHLGLKLEGNPLYDCLKNQFLDNDYNALSDEFTSVVEKICNAWNFDNSDPYTDYFDVNYYLNVTGENIEVIQ